MRTLLRKIRRRLRRLKVRQEALSQQKKILGLAERRPPVMLDWQPPRTGRGGLGNYYHFVVDLLLPLNHLTSKQIPSNSLEIEDFGPLAKYMVAAYGDTIKVTPSREAKTGQAQSVIYGMNPRILHVKRSEITRFRLEMFRRLGVEMCSRPNKLVLIERAPEPNRSHTGSAARSIQDFSALAAEIEASCPRPLEFHHAILDGMTMRNQLMLFDSAAIVVAQHGAGLTNILWMKSGTKVVEISPYKHNRPHFEILSGLRALEYTRINQRGKHGAVEFESVVSAIQSTSL